MCRSLCVESAYTEQILEPIESQAPVLNRIRDIATGVIQNKVIYEADIIELLDRIACIEE